MGRSLVYGTYDVGVGYESNGAAYTPAWNNGVNSFITKQNYGAKWLFTPNGLSQSVIGLKMSQSLAPLGMPGWSLIGTVETGFNPYLAIWPTLSARRFRTTAGRSRCKAPTRIQAAPGSGTIRRRSSVLATRRSEP